MRPRAWLLPTEPKGQAEGGSIPEDQQRAAALTSRCARIPRRADRATHAVVRRPARDRAAVARLPTYQKPGRGEQAGLSSPDGVIETSHRDSTSRGYAVGYRHLPARVAGSGSKRIRAAPMALSGARPQWRSDGIPDSRTGVHDSNSLDRREAQMQVWTATGIPGTPNHVRG